MLRWQRPLGGTMSRIRLALAIATVLAAGIVRGQSVSSSCVGEIKSDGSLDRSACSHVPTGPTGGASGLTSAQQLQLQGTQAIINGLAPVITNMILGDPAAAADKRKLEQQQRLLEQQRQQQLAEQRRQRAEAARLRFEQEQG